MAARCLRVAGRSNTGVGRAGDTHTIPSRAQPALGVGSFGQHVAPEEDVALALATIEKYPASQGARWGAAPQAPDPEATTEDSAEGIAKHERWAAE